MMQPFQQTFEDSCNFVRLHGWVDQTNSRIVALQALIRADRSVWPSIATLLADALERVESVEEKLLIFVLQADLGSAPDAIAEQMYRHLHGRLTSKDSNFITSQFFRNLSPIPEEIVYDIIKRNFISYQRAIFQALKVSGFESAFDPPHILLFLIQLLCRNNLNEQNRAIIYLLLSRLDIELPPSIEQIVATAMLGLRDVIQEVERRLEAVLSDTLTANDLTLENTDWEDLEAAVKPPRPAVTPASPVAAPVPPPGELFNRPAETVAAQPKAAPVKGMPYAGTYFDAPAGATMASVDSPATVGPAKPAVPARPPVAAPDAVSGPSDAGGGDAEPIPTVSSKPQAPIFDTAEYQAARKVQGPAIESFLSPDGPLGDNGPQTFQISFSRETTELKAVLQALKQISAATGLGKAAGDSLVDRTSQRVELFWRLIKAFLKSKWGIALGVLLLAVLALVLLFRFGLTAPVVKDNIPSGSAANLVPNAAMPAPAANHPPAAIPESGMAPVNLASNFDQSAAGSLPVIKSAAGISTWYPRKGDSLWVLYSWIRNDPQPTPALAGLVKGEWQGFLQRIAALNPGMTFPDSIYPDKPIIIQLNP